MNAYTTKEYTAIYLRVPAAQFAHAVELLCDVVLNPSLLPDDFEAERQVILEELHLQLDESDDLVHTMLYESLFPDHPLGWEIVGHEASIKALTPKAVRNFHNGWYVPANLVFAAAGPIDHAEFTKAVRGCLAAKRKSHGPSPSAARSPARRPPRKAPIARNLRRRPAESAHLTFGWRGVDHFDKDRFALALMNQIVGGGMSSRLFQTIREERGLAYSVYSSAATYSDSGVFSIYAGTTPESTRLVVDLTKEIADDVATHGVTKHELDVAKRAFEGSTVMGLEDTGSRMARLGVSLISPRRGDPARALSTPSASGNAARCAARGVSRDG